MKAFTQLVEQLHSSASGGTSQAALLDYVLHSPEEDLSWAIAFLLNARPFPRLLTQKQLVNAARNAAGLSDWLTDACRDEVGDPAEVAALLAPRAVQALLNPLSALIKTRCLPLRGLDEKAQEAFLCSAWRGLDLRSRRVWHRMLLGTLKFQLERPALAAALSQRYSVPAPLILQRLDSLALSNATAGWLTRLAAPPESDESLGWPLSWGQLSESLPTDPNALSRCDWVCEQKPRGRRIQLIRRTSRTFVWSPEGDLLNRDLPELLEAVQALEIGIVLEGTWVVNPPDIHAGLDSEPSRGEFWVEDILEYDGIDQRGQTLEERRQWLEQILSSARIRFQKDWKPASRPEAIQGAVQPELFLRDTTSARSADHWPLRLIAAMPLEDWGALPRLRELARADGYAGIQLRSLRGVHPGSQAWQADHGIWLTNDLHHCTAALLSVEFGGTEPKYSLGIQSQGRWMTIARISGEPPEPERDYVATFIQEHTTQKFGSTRLLEPSLLVRLSYEFKARSSRLKSGLRLVGARWVCLLPNASVQDCFRLDAL